MCKLSACYVDWPLQARSTAIAHVGRGGEGGWGECKGRGAPHFSRGQKLCPDDLPAGEARGVQAPSQGASAGGVGSNISEQLQSCGSMRNLAGGCDDLPQPGGVRTSPSWGLPLAHPLPCTPSNPCELPRGSSLSPPSHPLCLWLL